MVATVLPRCNLTLDTRKFRVSSLNTQLGTQYGEVDTRDCRFKMGHSNMHEFR